MGHKNKHKLYCKEYIQITHEKLSLILKNVFMTLYNRYIEKKYKSIPYFITYFYDKQKNEFINFCVYKKNSTEKKIIIELICNENKDNVHNKKLIYFLLKNLAYYYKDYTFNISPNQKSKELFSNFGFTSSNSNNDSDLLYARSDNIKSNINSSVFQKKSNSKNSNLYYFTK